MRIFSTKMTWVMTLTATRAGVAGRGEARKTKGKFCWRMSSCLLRWRNWEPACSASSCWTMRSGTNSNSVPTAQTAEASLTPLTASRASSRSSSLRRAGLPSGRKCKTSFLGFTLWLSVKLSMSGMMKTTMMRTLLMTFDWVFPDMPLLRIF